MRNFIAAIFVTLVGAAELGAIAWMLVLPRLDWGAGNPPGAVEQELARNILGRWIHRNARTGTNPLAATGENLKAAQTDYSTHCSMKSDSSLSLGRPTTDQHHRLVQQRVDCRAVAQSCLHQAGSLGQRLLGLLVLLVPVGTFSMMRACVCASITLGRTARSSFT